ncbi:MAG: TonB-dependent receptor, partial [Candidatus Accumulibacter sp.]|nr:TonB-dependent receptor [Accumulibacter sp.]
MPNNSHPQRLFKPKSLYFLMLCAITAQAQEARDPVLRTVDVVGPRETATLNLSTPSQTGSRTGLSAKELPASLESIDSQTIAERGDTQIIDAITRTTGLSVRPSPGNGGLSFSSRGFAGVQSVAVAEDGVRIQTASGTINYPSSTWGYERFDVVRGPASVVLGSGTVGATINAIRKQPTRESRQEVMFGLGTDGYKRMGVGASGALGPITTYRVDAYGFHNEGWHDLGESRGGKLMSTFRIQPNSDLKFDLIADYSVERPDRYYGTPWDSNRHIDKSLKKESYNARDALVRYEELRLRAKADWRVNDWLNINNELYRLESKRTWKNIERYALNSATNMVTRSEYLYIRHDLEQTGNRLEAVVKAAEHRAVFGWETARIDFKHTNNSPWGGNSVVSASNPEHGYYWTSTTTPLNAVVPKWKTASTFNAFYAEDVWKFHDRWQLLAGIRRDFSKVSRDGLFPGEASFGNQSVNGTAWRVGLTHFLTRDTNLYAQYSAGHDPVTDLITSNLTNLKYRLTKGRQVEAGIKQTLPNGLGEWTAAVFRIEKKDIITRDPVNSALSVQGGKQHSQGVELGAAISPTKNWRFEGNYTLLQARFDELTDEINGAAVSRDGKMPPLVARQTANLWGHYRLAEWQGSLGLRYVGKRYTDNANTAEIPAYTVADASLA